MMAVAYLARKEGFQPWNFLPLKFSAQQRHE